MILAFAGIGTFEIIVILLALFLTIAVGNYGRDTKLGYWGSVLLSIFSSPIVAAIIIYAIKPKKTPKL